MRDHSAEEVRALLNGRVPTRKEGQEAVLESQTQSVDHQMVGAGGVDSGVSWPEINARPKNLTQLVEFPGIHPLAQETA